MLKRKFELITKKNIRNHWIIYFKMIDVKNKMELNSHDLMNKVLVEKTLNTLPMKFDHMVVVIQETKDLSTMTIEELQVR